MSISLNGLFIIINRIYIVFVQIEFLFFNSDFPAG